MKGILRKFTILLVAVAVTVGALAMPMSTVEAATSKATVKKQATKVVDKQTKKSDSKKQKLEKLFEYCEKTYGYKRVYGFANKKGWERDFAVEIYKGKKGSCYHFAAAYAFLAKKATGYSVRIGVGKTNGFSGELQDHAWVEVKIGKTWYVCDPNMDKFAAESSGKYYLKKRNSLKKVYNNYKKVKYVNVTF